MIDLHIHTTYSDGTYDLKKTLEEAKKANVSMISITDHDTIDAYKELKTFDVSKYYDGEIIVGAEFNTIFEKYKFELLGYDFDVNKLENWVESRYVKEKDLDLNKEFEILLEASKKHGIKIENGLFYERSMGWPVDVIYNSIIKYPENKKFFEDKEWENSKMFFRAATCRIDFPLYIDFSFLYPNAYEVSEKVRNAGGKVFIAHLFYYPIEDHMNFLDKLRKEKIIDGVEVYHSTFTEEQSNILKEYCHKYGLYMSGGTDYHGENNNDKHIGTGYGNMKIEDNLINNWHKEI